MKAACSALTPAVQSGNAKAVCEKFTNGFCAPYSEGDQDCGSLARAEAHQSVCKETDDSYTCATADNDVVTNHPSLGEWARNLCDRFHSPKHYFGNMPETVRVYPANMSTQIGA